MPGWGSHAGAPFGAAEIARPAADSEHRRQPHTDRVPLQVAGYVTLGPEGWAATAVGCATIEQSRAVGTMVRTQNGAYFRLTFGGSLT
jgi:hypothetical protein